MIHAPSWDTIYIRRKGILIGGIAALLPCYLFIPRAPVQFICLFLLFILISSRLYSEYLIRNIRITRCDAELRAFRHEWVRVELRVENYGRLPAFMLAVGDAAEPFPSFKNQKILCTLTPHSWILHAWQGHCADRGVFTVGPATIRGADPLGLFPFQLTARETSRLFVYPVFCSIIITPPGGIPLGNMLSFNPLFEDITRRRSLRPYQSGDELRRVNWKQSARMSQINTMEGGARMPQSGGLMVNEYEATALYPLMVFLNLDRNEYPVKKEAAYIERTIEAATALCLRSSRERQELGIVLYTSDQEEGVSVIAPAAFTLVPILERLAALDWTKTLHTNQEAAGYLRSSARAMLEQGKRLPYGTRFLYAGPDLGDEAYIALNSLKKHHLSLEYLIIDDRLMPHLVPGNSPRYKMKEWGNEII